MNKNRIKVLLKTGEQINDVIYGYHNIGKMIFLEARKILVQVVDYHISTDDIIYICDEVY